MVLCTITACLAEPQELPDLATWLGNRAFTPGVSALAHSQIFLGDVVELGNAILDVRLFQRCPPPPPLLAVLVLDYLAIGIGDSRRRARKDMGKGDDKEAGNHGRREQGGGHPRPWVQVRRWHGGVDRKRGADQVAGSWRSGSRGRISTGVSFILPQARLLEKSVLLIVVLARCANLLSLDCFAPLPRYSTQ